MRMTIKGNEARIVLNEDDALDLAVRLTQAVQKARRHGQWGVTCPMPICVDQAANDMPGVVFFSLNENGP